MCSYTNINRPWLYLIFRKLKKNENIKVENLNNNFKSTTSSKVIADFINFLIKKNIVIKETFNFVSKNPIKMKKILNYTKIKLKSKSKIFKDNNTLKKSYLVSYKKLSKKLKIEIPSTKKIIVNHVSNFT